MKIYMAALHSNGYRHTNRYLKLNDHEKKVVDGLPYLLESYHYINKETFVRAIRDRGDHVFLDSGAFSAFTLGVDINLVGYCDYIKRNEDILAREDMLPIASVLDGIGDAHLTYENQLAMEREGVHPLPCFHAGEDERYLEWYVDNYDYITLGGMVGTSTKMLMVWLDRIWKKYLLNENGRAKIKVHGFGITAISVMKRYPWWSCDSSSWIQSAAYGAVVSPKFGALQVSDRSPSRKDAGQHVDNLTPIHRAAVIAAFEEEGFEYERLATVYESRAAYNLWSFSEINKMINDAEHTDYPMHVQELF